MTPAHQSFGRGLCHYPAMLIFSGLVVGWLLAGDWWLGLGT